MKTVIALGRIIRTGFVNFWRNRWLSAASTLIMVITLLIFSTIGLLFFITQLSVTTVRERVDISAYFKTGLAEVNITPIKQELEQDPKIRSVRYVSADEALAEFKQNHINETLITDSIAELNENPLPATLQIKAYNLSDYPAIAEQLRDQKYSGVIDKVNYEDNQLLIERLNKILTLIITVGLALLIIFSAIAVLVIFNTITLTIYNRREEVEIMRLVGATNGYIRGPFIVEALLYSIVATIIVTLAFSPLLSSMLTNLNQFIGAGSSSINNIILPSKFALLTYFALAQIVVASTLSIVSSLLAIRRYLKI